MIHVKKKNEIKIIKNIAKSFFFFFFLILHALDKFFLDLNYKNKKCLIQKIKHR